MIDAGFVTVALARLQFERERHVQAVIDRRRGHARRPRALLRGRSVDLVRRAAKLALIIAVSPTLLRLSLGQPVPEGYVSAEPLAVIGKLDSSCADGR